MTSSPRYPAVEMDAAKYSPLNAFPVSTEAERLCEDLAVKLFHQSARRPGKPMMKAVGALVADLLQRDPAHLGGWMFREFSRASFTKGPVGYRTTKQFFDELKAGGMVDSVTGNMVWTDSEFAAGRHPEWKRATRFRATAAFREWFASRGITRETWDLHFERSEEIHLGSAASVILRAARPANAGPKAKARDMIPHPEDTLFPEIKQRMERLNAYLSEQTIAPFPAVFLRRIFANGDQQTPYQWNQGGRLYALGDESYQNARKEDRAAITINGKRTVELDLRAAHLTIIVGMGHIPASVLEGDPYAIEGLPREIAKQWVTMTLSHGKRHRQWPREIAAEYLRKHVRKLSDDFPLRRTGDLILSKLPIIGEDGQTAPVTWAELQYQDSEIMLKALERLAFDHGVPALPVHDSLIVAEDAKDLAVTLLKATFAEKVGIVPEIA